VDKAPKLPVLGIDPTGAPPPVLVFRSGGLPGAAALPDPGVVDAGAGEQVATSQVYTSPVSVTAAQRVLLAATLTNTGVVHAGGSAVGVHTPALLLAGELTPEVAV
jgi:hypothetical protein